MSWQLASFSLLTLALAGGFGWYERTRPDARIVALVAALAAFAALGRIAFAALPNVKPTTDIVLISGYALGGAPGFAVGAIAGLSSNFFFGQGPWTPWQMAAWGATGVIGAGLAVVTRERIGRWPLSAVCALVGFGFAAVQDIGDWATYSDHSTAQLGVYVGKGIGFDFIHAAGCLLFALALGPWLTRSVQRFSRRLRVTWLVPAALLVLMIPASAQAATTPTAYLLAAQHRDGGFGSSPGQPSSQLYSGWVALGLGAAGHNPQDVIHGGGSLLSYVRAGAGSIPDVGSLERTILVARAAGVSARNFGGRDLVAALQGDVRADGSVSEQVNLTSFAVIALRAAGVSPAAKTLQWLAGQQDSDGGFNFATAGGSSDVDDTGAALEALGHNGRAVGFIRGHQNPDGGFPLEPGGGSNAQSTAWAVQGLLAAGVNLGSLRRGSPLAFLRSLIGPDGHVHYSRTSDQTPVWVTAQALMALERKPLPLAPVPRRHGRARRGAGRRGRYSQHVGAAGDAGSGRGAASVPPALQTLAADAGVAAALALAPVGVG